jgi:hypothetical protein
MFTNYDLPNNYQQKYADINNKSVKKGKILITNSLPVYCQNRQKLKTNGFQFFYYFALKNA